MADSVELLNAACVALLRFEAELTLETETAFVPHPLRQSGLYMFLRSIEIDEQDMECFKCWQNHLLKTGYLDPRS